jgi:uncharacterized protein
MQLTRDDNSNAYRIRAWQPGKIHINESWYEGSVIISADKLITDWPPQTFAELQIEHLDAILTLNPTTVIIGSGVKSQFLPAELLMVFYSKQIGVEIMDSAAACRTYSILAAEGRNIAAALLIR